MFTRRREHDLNEEFNKLSIILNMLSAIKSSHSEF